MLQYEIEGKEFKVAEVEPEVEPIVNDVPVPFPAASARAALDEAKNDDLAMPPSPPSVASVPPIVPIFDGDNRRKRRNDDGEVPVQKKSKK